MRAPSQADIAEAIARSKREVLEDIAAGRVPADVASFSALHDHVDANEYGGLCEPGVWYDDGADVGIAHAAEAANEVQDAVDAWLEAGRPTGAPVMVVIPCGWCDAAVPVAEDRGQVVYCGPSHAALDRYLPEG